MTGNEFRPIQTPKGHQKTEAAMELFDFRLKDCG